MENFIFDRELCSCSPKKYFLIGMQFQDVSSVVTDYHKGSFCSTLLVIDKGEFFQLLNKVQNIYLG